MGFRRISGDTTLNSFRLRYRRIKDRVPRFILKSPQLILLLLILVSSGCAQYSFKEVYNDLKSGRDRGHYIEDVPFIRQKQNYCGPAALATILRFHGQKATQDELAKIIYREKISGSPNLLLVTEARKRGLWSDPTHRGDLQGMKRYIEEDLPVIVMGRQKYPPGGMYHFMVLIGYDDTKKVVILHTGNYRNVVMTYKHFRRWWAARTVDWSKSRDKIPNSNKKKGIQVRSPGPDKWYLLACRPDRLPSTEYIRLGVEADGRGDRKVAQTMYTEGLRKAGWHYNRAWASMNLGLVALSDKDVAKAEKHLRNAKAFMEACSKDDPEFMMEPRPVHTYARTLNILAWILGVEQDRADEALLLIRDALKLCPKDADFLDTSMKVKLKLKADLRE